MLVEVIFGFRDTNTVKIDTPNFNLNNTSQIKPMVNVIKIRMIVYFKYFLLEYVSCILNL